MVKKGSPEALAFSGVRNCGLEGGLHDGARHCRDIDARGGNAFQGPLESLARRSKEIAVGHSYALKANAACPNRRSSNQVVSRKFLDPSRLKVDYKARDALPTGSRLRLGVHDKEIGDRPICDPRFLAANLPPARNFGREGPDRPEVAASLGLAQRRRANKRALHQSRQIVRNLLGCSLTLNSGDGALHVDQRESARKARACDRLGDGDPREEARSRAATLGRNLHAIQPEADPFRNNAGRERGFLSLQALGYRGDHLVRKSPRDSDKRALRRSEREREFSWILRRVRRFGHGLIRSGRLTRVYQSPMARPTGSGDRDAETMRLHGRQPAHRA